MKEPNFAQIMDEWIEEKLKQYPEAREKHTDIERFLAYKKAQRKAEVKRMTGDIPNPNPLPNQSNS